MQVRSCGASGGTDIPDSLPLTDSIAVGDGQSGHVRINRGGASVVDDDVVAVYLALGIGVAVSVVWPQGVLPAPLEIRVAPSVRDAFKADITRLCDVQDCRPAFRLLPQPDVLTLAPKAGATGEP